MGTESGEERWSSNSIILDEVGRKGIYKTIINCAKGRRYVRPPDTVGCVPDVDSLGLHEAFHTLSARQGDVWERVLYPQFNSSHQIPGAVAFSKGIVAGSNRTKLVSSTVRLVPCHPKRRGGMQMAIVPELQPSSYVQVGEPTAQNCAECPRPSTGFVNSFVRF
jgi:hypothetical protein